MTDEFTSSLESAEKQRCAALMAHDIEAIEAALVPGYIHVHANGRREDRDSYLAFLRGPVRYRSVSRGKLDILQYGNAAVMVGDLTVGAVVAAGSDAVHMSFVVMQLWDRTGGNWRLAAYQATQLPG